MRIQLINDVLEILDMLKASLILFAVKVLQFISFHVRFSVAIIYV